MTQYRVTEKGLRLIPAFLKMITDCAPSHWVTLNFHADYQLEKGKKLLRLWSLDLVSRLFQAKPFASFKLGQLFRFIAFPEYTRTDHLHYHLPLGVHEARRDWFKKVAAPMWHKLVPTGTADVQVINQTADDLNRIGIYATKHASRPFSYENYVTSNMLDLPENVGPTRSRPLASPKEGT